MITPTAVCTTWWRAFTNNIAVEPVNTHRQLALDVARGLAVCFMILIHVMEIFSRAEVNHTVFGYLVGFLGGPPTAPVFMFVMGIGSVFSTRAVPHTMIIRGLKLYVAGYILSFVHLVLPAWIAAQTGLTLAADLQRIHHITYGDVLFQINILHLAGIVYIVLGVLKMLPLALPWYPAIAVLVGTVAPLLWGCYTGRVWIDVFLDALWGNKPLVFPFFSWGVYPLCGVAAGYWLIRSKNPAIFYRSLMLVGAIGFLLGGALVLVFKAHSGMSYLEAEQYYWRHGIELNCLMLGFVGLWLGLIAYLTPTLSPRITQRLVFWSQHVTTIYWIHWILIGWSALCITMQTVNLPLTVLLMGLYVIASDRLCVCYTQAKTVLQQRRRRYLQTQG
jgi:uncharacterized membrane protein